MDDVTREANRENRWEYEKKIEVYHNFVGYALKALAFVLGIQAVLLKFAMDSVVNRRVFCVAGIFITLISSVFVAAAVPYAKAVQSELAELAKNTNTGTIDVRVHILGIKLLLLAAALMLAGWIYIYGWIPN